MSSAHRIASDMFQAAPETPDPGASGTIIPVKSYSICPLVSAAAETRTLARPTKTGTILVLQHRTDGGDITLTVTGGYNENGATTMTFSDAGQMISLIAMSDASGTLYWRTMAGFPTTAALTAAKPNITIADAEGSADNAIAAVINSSAYGFSNAAELITVLYKIQNLVTRVGEIEVILQNAGLAR